MSLLRAAPLKLGPWVPSAEVPERHDSLEWIEQLKRELVPPFCAHDPLRCSDRSVYSRLCEAITPIFFALVAPSEAVASIKLPEGCMRLLPKEVVHVESSAGAPPIIRMSRGIYLEDVQKAVTDAASELVLSGGAPLLDGGCFTPELVAELLQVAVDSQHWVTPPESEVFNDWERVEK